MHFHIGPCWLLIFYLLFIWTPCFWFYYHGAIEFSNLSLITATIFIFMTFVLIGFRVFKTYSGIIRYSSFVDLQRVGFAMFLSFAIAELVHYAISIWDTKPIFFNIKFVRLEGRQIAAMYLVATVGMVIFPNNSKNYVRFIFKSKS